MTDLLQLVSAFFARNEWEHELLDAPRALEFNHTRSGLPTKSRATITGGGPILVYDSLCLERVPQEHRSEVAEYLTRVNADLPVGAFDMDWDAGEVRFRTSIDLQGEQLTDALLRGVVLSNHQAMIDWLGHLLSVISGEMTGATAYHEARNSIG